MDILEEIGKRSVHDLIARGIRLDNRKLLEYRKIKIQKNVVPNANGSALCKLGKTQVLAGIKFGIGAPYPDKPDEGAISFNAEFTGLASPTFELGPPNQDAIELARVVDRGFRSSGIIDLKKFFINEKNVLVLYVDLHVLDFDGNLFDACYLATMAALTNTKKPKVEVDNVNKTAKIIYGEFDGNLELQGIVTSSTFAVVKDKIMLDPNRLEESAMDAGIVMAVQDDNLVAVQKLGYDGLTKQQILNMVDVSFQKHQELKKFVQES
ncbi:MAG: exosome complex protein Rrp42 [Candidatus Micrarchaeota archaeon]|nr:exosome complex protein Rrp42 [Candidatus Micrarchaeota archaeon]